MSSANINSQITELDEREGQKSSSPVQATRCASHSDLAEPRTLAWPGSRSAWLTADPRARPAGLEFLTARKEVAPVVRAKNWFIWKADGRAEVLQKEVLFADDNSSKTCNRRGRSGTLHSIAKRCGNHNHQVNRAHFFSPKNFHLLVNVVKM